MIKRTFSDNENKTLVKGDKNLDNLDKEAKTKTTSSALFVKKCMPKTTKQIIGQENAVLQLKTFIQNYSKQKKKGLLIYGPPGSGKTCAVHAAANELNCEILEINASDFRDAESLNAIVGSAIKQRSLLFRNKVILVDELDGISGAQDRGGISTLTGLLSETIFPIILTANDPFDKKFSSLRAKCCLVEFSLLSPANIFDVLTKICEAEKIIYDEESLRTLARRSGGDLRGAINDLQTLSSAGLSSAGLSSAGNLSAGEIRRITKADVDLLGDREKEEAIENALLKIFKTTDEKIALTSLDYVAEDLDECFLWLEENIPLEYTKPSDIAAAYYFLSRADVFRRRIRRWQHWRFQAYIAEYLTAGIALAKHEKYKNAIKYQRTQRILAIWIASNKNKRRKDIAQKIAGKLHTSAKRVLKDDLPYIRIMLKKNKKIGEKIADDLGLDEEDIEYLKK